MGAQPSLLILNGQYHYFTYSTLSELAFFSHLHFQTLSDNFIRNLDHSFHICLTKTVTKIKKYIKDTSSPPDVSECASFNV